ncbi:hypothetical protein H4V97_001626 [Flavobacterium sp. CG_23.5]|uniref:hypothetical protein n=1 Tax=Flavobacterium sp. CG_23.5 TaxID=2760708 RepID=UPI001AE521ED|nr:hypothetical protein [Flavobacterium sp. CG_23.5]MBP2283308.1 hypothetical protein [Flavobacterium sp. CG_23.5]
MKAPKTISSLPSFKLEANRTKEIPPIPANEIIHPRVKIITTATLGQKSADSLLALMYSQENEVLFI